MTAIRVLPPFDPRGTAVLHGLIGAATALPFWAGRPWAAPTVFISLLPAPGARTWYVTAAGLALPVVMAAWLSLRCRQRRPLFLAGFAFGACQVASWFLALVVPHQPVLWQPGALGVVFVSASAAVIGAICGLAYLLVHWIFREAWFEIAVQDGSLCWTCAYRVGDPPLSDRCPECGTPTGSPGKRTHGTGAVRRFMKRHARLGASLALAGIAAIVAWREIAGCLAMAPFNRNVAGTHMRGAVMQIDRSAPVSRFSGMMWEAEGKWRPIPGDPTKALVVYYLRGAGGSRPAMQLQLTGFAGTGAAVLPMAGNPLITCDLSPDQAAYVLEHDVPQSLIDAMLQEAVKSGWVPMPGGGVLTCAEVPPDDHFPEAPP